MTNSPLVTVVVPVYKVERYFDRCMQSVVNQTYRNLEIILVDDGSPDQCPQMCDTWARTDSRIKVIHKENAGLGMARNTGIDYATGEYICFVDSDDYVSLEMVELALDRALKTEADIVLYGIGCIPCSPKDVYCGKEVCEDFLPIIIGPDPKTGKTYGLSLSACRVLISMERIQTANWRFVSERDIISEDYYSMMMLYKYVNKVAVLRKSLYHYCYNETSLSRSYRPDRCEMNRRFYLECLSLCRKNGYSAEVERRIAAPYMNAMLAAMKQTVYHYNNPFEAIRSLHLIIKDDVLQQVLQERKRDYFNQKKKILFWAMRYKSALLCYLLVKGKLDSDKRKKGRKR